MKQYLVAILISLCIWPTLLLAKQVVNVGVSYRTPYYMEGDRGIAVQYVEAMNQVQHQYDFRLVAFPTQRKIQAMEEGWVDLVMWDNPKWGWQNKNVKVSLPLINSQDVYVTLNLNGRNQTYFDDLANKKLGITRGFHYRFAGFNNDPKEISAKHDVVFVRNEEDAIGILLANRVDIAVTNDVTLAWYIKRFPRYKEMLLIGNNPDSTFNRYAILSATSPIPLIDINHVIRLVHEQGMKENIFAGYGLVNRLYAKY